ncbi:MAG: anthranilate synthase component I family protein [Methanomassiliicoccaceae archaeon]|nr:anthranilate synthase component I family protein [Methanomassiliicoccaceae archaeon]
MIRPTLEEARRLAKGNETDGENSVIPISIELFSDIRTPMEILNLIRKKGKNAYILESVENGESWGRYTFLGYDPSMTITGNDGVVVIKTAAGETEKKGNSHIILKDIISAYKSPRILYLPTFTGGFVGYFSYEYAKYVEYGLELKAKNPCSYNDFCLMLFNRVIAVDHFRQKIFLITNIKTQDLEQEYIKGVTDLKDMEKLVTGDRKDDFPIGRIRSEFTPRFTEAEFVGIVERLKHHIREGDIFQCVPSIELSADYEGDLLQAYRALRTINPSSYMFYMEFDDMQIAGASPETLVSLKDGVISTYPLAGTCKRADDDRETQRLIVELLDDEKELSEHDMLVDLSRNDLGKVCEFGSVNVNEYRGIKICSHVCHIESRVVGDIRPEYDAFDAMAAVLPAGTLSGAPKKRAMELIDELEGEKRGVYGGAVGYIDFTGDMDLCIGIRMAVLKDGSVHVQAGAGIVADSIPLNEYKECRNKAEAMLKAIRGVAE